MGHDLTALLKQGRSHGGDHRSRNEGWIAAARLRYDQSRLGACLGQRQRSRGFGIRDACRRDAAIGETNLIRLRQIGAAVERPG